METGSTVENKVGLIPNIVVQGSLGPKTYAILVTDKRSILVLESSSKAGLGAAFGAIGAAVAHAATSSRRSFDYENADTASLASDQKNIAIPHERLEGLELKKAVLGPIYRFNIEYTTQDGKSKKVKGQLVPPNEHVKRRKEEGIGKKVIFYDYAKKCRTYTKE